MGQINFARIPEADVILNAVEERHRKGLGTNVFVIGLSGTGKSSTSIRLGELIQGERTNERTRKSKLFVVDSLLEFIRALRNSNIGDIIITEEVSVLFSSRRAMASDNVNVGKVLDTCRKKRLTIIANAPIWGSIDSHMRAMGHILIETLRINKTQMVVISKFHRLQTNPSSGKTYRHTMQRKGKDIGRMFTRMPSKELWDTYEENKDIFMDNLYKDLENQELLKRKKREKENIKLGDNIKDLTEQELLVHHLLNVKGMKQTEIADKLNLTGARITHIKQNINKKLKITKENEQININNRGKEAIK